MPDHDLIVVDFGLPLAEGVTLTPTGATISATLTLDQFLAAVKNANTLTTASLWAIGDLLLYGERQPAWGDAYTQALDLSERSAWVLTNAMRLATAYPVAERVPGLSWSHHRDALHLKDPLERTHLLTTAAAESLSREEMKGRMGLTVQPRAIPVDDGPYTVCPQCQHRWRTTP